jgi:hypothetical protein
MTLLQILLIIFGSMLLLYMLRKPISEFVKFIFDNFFAVILDKLGGWIENFLKYIKNQWDLVANKLSFSRLVTSVFLSLVLVLLCTSNYYLIYYGLEILLPSEEGTGALGFTPAGLFSLVIMLTELLIGFVVLETIGFTDLFNLDKFPKIKILRIIMFSVLAILILAEVALAVYRTSQTALIEKADTGFEKFMSSLSYWIVGAIAFVVPVLITVLGFVLRDLFLFIAIVLLSITYVLFFLLNLIFTVLKNIITHIDDILNAILHILTKPVELIVNFILFILVKLKIVKPIVILIISLPFLFSTISFGKDQKPQPKLIIVLLDNSGSFKNFRDKAIDHCLKFIDAMHGGDKFALFLIESESLKRNESPINFTIPPPKGTIPTIIERKQMDSTKKANKEKISKLKKRELSGHTDIWGALMRASQFINSNLYTKYQKFLLIYSDMQDTKQRGPKLSINFENVCVKIFYADINEQTVKAIEFWKNKLSEYKAISVQVFTPDDSETMTDFTIKCEEQK